MAFEHFLPRCNLKGVSKLTKFVALTVLALWSLAAMHCKLEALPGLEFLKSCCFVETTTPSPKNCESDGCGAVEDGGYRMEEQTATAPQPLLIIAMLPAALEAPLPDLQNFSPTASLPPPDLPKVWQFTLRAALPPRAPSFIS